MNIIIILSSFFLVLVVEGKFREGGDGVDFRHTVVTGDY